jgi:hydroxypyruvate reductase
MHRMNETAQLNSIFGAGLQAADSRQLMARHVALDGSRLTVAADGRRHEVDLDGFGRILVLGAGKASANMALALEAILGERISGGLISVKHGHGAPLRRIEVVEAGHPVPDAKGEEAARRIARLAEEADSQTLVLNLISGGGSALLPLPAEGLTLEEKQEITGLLLASGADIHEINSVRKHLSRLKGGRLLRLLAPARSLNFILSDVLGDRLDTIASGLTAPDATTFADALRVIDRYGLRGKVPAAALRILEEGAAGLLEETLKPDDPAAALSTNIVLGSNRMAVLAACEAARALGYHTVALTSSLSGEAREVAKVLYGIARDVRNHGLLAKTPACIVAGGETTVTLRGNGKGGRNQEMALAFLAELSRDELRGQGIHFLSAATDGSDGPTDAAGAFASMEVLEQVDAAGLSIARSLAANDSYRFFAGLGQLLKTGPTMTNVCDLQIMLIP